MTHAWTAAMTEEPPYSLSIKQSPGSLSPHRETGPHRLSDRWDGQLRKESTSWKKYQEEPSPHLPTEQGQELSQPQPCPREASAEASTGTSS